MPTELRSVTLELHGVTRGLRNATKGSSILPEEFVSVTRQLVRLTEARRVRSTELSGVAIECAHGAGE